MLRHSLHLCSTSKAVLLKPIPLSTRIREFYTNGNLFNRFGRPSKRRRPVSQPQTKQFHPESEVHADSVGLRPASDLWKAIGFTGAIALGTYTLAAYSEYERVKDTLKKSVGNFFSDFSANVFGTQHLHNNQDSELFTPGQKMIFVIIALNCLVTLLWQMPLIRPQMFRWFTNSFAQRSLCIPMISSVFSHSSLIHLGLNMYVLHSFASVSIDKFLGVDQFLAFYLTGGVVSSFISLVHKSATKVPTRALGASGAIFAILIYTCMKIPDAQLSIIFLPMFTFSAENAAYGAMAFDLIGLLFGFKLFDHSAHLGGALFGLWYAKYGQELVETKFFPFVQKYLN